MKTIAEQLNIKEFPFVIRDSKGYQIYFERSNGFWWRSERDSKGNEIYFENSNGEWYKSEFDLDGNRIYYENSKSYWYKREYDSNGKMIYHENSDGFIEDDRKIPYSMRVQMVLSKIIEKFQNTLWKN